MDLIIDSKKCVNTLSIGDIVVVEFKNSGIFKAIVSVVKGDYMLRSVDGETYGFSGNSNLEDLYKEIKEYDAPFVVYPKSEYELVLRRK